MKGRGTSMAIVVTIGALLMMPISAQAAGGGSSSRVDPQESYQDCLKYLEEQEYRRASRACRKALDELDDDADVNYAMGLAEIGRERWRSAQRYLEKAVELRGDFVEARQKLAEVCIERGNEECASEQLTALEELLAACEECTEERKGAIQAAIEAVKAAMAGDAKPSNHSALPMGGFAVGDRHYNAAVKLINTGQYAAAIESLYEAKRHAGPHPDILNYLGFAHRKLERFEEAKGYYRQALTLDPDHKGATEYLGELHLQLGNVAEAKKLLAKLDRLCAFGCAEREDLASLIAAHEQTAVR